MRYLTQFDLEKIDIFHTDVLVVGSGIAGLTAAFECAPNYKTTVLTKSYISDTATWYAQGGIASAISDNDSLDLHYQDTIKAGAGLCDEKVVKTIIDDSLEAIKFLKKIGAEFDHLNGDTLLALEGGHSRPRILHRRDYTGSEVQQKLVKAVLEEKGINVIENAFTVDLLTKDNRCLGLLAKKGNKLFAILAKAVILATGGAGQLFSVTTNPAISTGDGIAMAYRANAKLMDMEFVQFHPTSLHSRKNPRFLITEAIRGAGAYLLDSDGKRFLTEINNMAELGPRDIVAQGIFNQIQKQKEKFVYLDARHLDEDVLVNDFPSIYKACLDAGYDMINQTVPVSPAAHFIIGGIKTDINGLSSIKNLYASGECAATGFHGANRLASNSLLEGVVVSRRIASFIKNNKLEEIKKYKISNKANLAAYSLSKNIKREIQKLMWDDVGILRNAHDLKQAIKKIQAIKNKINKCNITTFSQMQVSNLVSLAEIIAKSALKRKESRGVHLREDYPSLNNDFRLHMEI